MERFNANNQEMLNNPIVGGVAMITDAIFDFFGGVVTGQKPNNSFQNAL